MVPYRVLLSITLLLSFLLVLTLLLVYALLARQQKESRAWLESFESGRTQLIAHYESALLIARQDVAKMQALVMSRDPLTVMNLSATLTPQSGSTEYIPTGTDEAEYAQIERLHGRIPEDELREDFDDAGFGG